MSHMLLIEFREAEKRPSCLYYSDSAYQHVLGYIFHLESENLVSSEARHSSACSWAGMRSVPTDPNSERGCYMARERVLRSERQPESCRSTLSLNSQRQQISSRVSVLLRTVLVPAVLPPAEHIGDLRTRGRTAFRCPASTCAFLNNLTHTLVTRAPPPQLATHKIE